MLLFVLIAGSATGLLLGIMGSGGAIVTVPALIYLLHVEPKSAIAMSLGIIAITATIAAFQSWRQGNVNLRVTLTFGLFGALGTFAGARLGVMIPVVAQLTLFALVMYAAAWRMLNSQPPRRSVGALAVGECESGDCANFPYRHIAGHGVMVGLLAGVVGVGGGFLIVPALVLLSGLSMKRAVGTSLSIVAFQSTAGFAGYAGAVPIDYPLLAGFTAVAVAASFLGARIGRHMDQQRLKRGFGVFLVLVASYILIKSLL
jgi:uncharacterized membrane protein YfcA